MQRGNKRTRLLRFWGGLLKMALEPVGMYGKILIVLAALSSIPVS